MPTKSLAELEALVGESRVSSVGFTVEAGKVEEFSRAIMDENRIHRSERAARAAGFDGIPAPLTFTRTARFPRYRPPEREGSGPHGFDLGFDRDRTVHGEQEYEFERPLVVGETLTGTVTLTDVYQREGARGGLMTFAVLETEFRDESGALAVTARHTRIETSGIDESTDGDDVER